ncbi:uncharacterized protein mms4 isoform X2 [Fopius arisanus]|uniref:Uncharacterized protein mms4 isoform X2 n=1 Tax=Fopius arisanus TaxID=64838 RepID=A0A9R1SWQ5_9HYME|nr:PREDICTED: uncharacterized protein LOC105263796 isoform X2 [Fopius arisanus]
MDDYGEDSQGEFPPVEFNYIPTADELIEKPVESTSSTGGKSKNSKAAKASDEQALKRKWIRNREKAEKLVAKTCRKNIQPGECMEFVRVNFDEGIGEFDFYQESVSLLEDANVRTQKIPLIIPNYVNWTRFTEIHTIDNNNQVNTGITEETHGHVMIIWKWNEVVEKIHGQVFTESLVNISKILQDKKLIVILYQMKGYFAYHKSENGGGKLKQKYDNIDLLPKISRKEFENAVVKTQIRLGCTITLIENSQDMSLSIFRYTKAIAEIPYKLMKEEGTKHLDFYAMDDNRNTIQVDSDGVGLKRLWLRQLCLFNNASLPTAEAICEIYPSPSRLMERINFLI